MPTPDDLDEELRLLYVASDWLWCRRRYRHPRRWLRPNKDVSDANT